jgi:predicted TIM-barrel fold metal-dependent hydrolase
MDKVPRRVIDAHTHIGELEPWRFYNLEHAVRPTVYDFPRRDDYVRDHLDRYGIERSIVISNYGVPRQEQPFELNDVVMDAATTSDRITAAAWVSFLPQNAELTHKALELASEGDVVALKTTFLLGGNPDPGTWDDETRRMADACFDAAAENDLVFHFHTSPGGASDINNYVPLVERYGKRNKIHLVHFGGGVSGHIKLVPQFLKWVEEGYLVYTDTTWTVGFGPRFLLTEIERTGVGGDRVLFASDEPWSDFWGEFWKVNGVAVSEELKERVFWRNFDELYGRRAG